MRFLHTSDWHLGASDHEMPLYDDQRFFIDEICKTAIQKNVDAVLISGDVYDRSVSSSEAIGLYNYAMTKLCKEAGKQVIVIAGNHDGAERLANLNELLTDSGLHILGIAQREPVSVSFDDTDVYLLPWITESKVKSLFPEESENIKSLSDAYRVMISHITESFDSGKKHVLLAHAYIADTETSESERATTIGTAPQVDASVFADFDYVALGHIHKPQDVTDKIRYSGTPMRYSFGKEENQEKSVTVIDTKDMSREIVPLAQLHTRRTFTDTFENLLHPTCTEEEKNGYVRLEVTDVFAGLNVISALRAVYPKFIEISGKNYEGENSKISLTMDEFEELQNDPREIFRHFCMEIVNETPSEHIMDMFSRALENAEEDS